ncbi:hypothetical protein PACTADRAFT_35536 [Pachysolen tannophilus NRRL Y-2460]|uniref:Protein BIG1 n=1 Tax=Pachysolen tannophilus NRRL Y-2460 TaxID=669874 RepID=A0A1E4TPU8_PACTA|nr:hypothetical protein PACTADRAFT_35536 [Pachysolen tannophilus NRRL Y-2460]
MVLVGGSSSMKSYVAVWVWLWVFLGTARATDDDVSYSFPSIFFSEQLIPGLLNKQHLKNNIYGVNELTSIIKSSVSECTSDAYFLINQPGLKLSDFEDFKDFGYLRAFISRSSSIFPSPNTITHDQGLNLDIIESYIKSHCKTDTYRVVNDNEAEVPHYIDIKKRIIRIEFSPLPENPEARKNTLIEHDMVFHNIARRLPSPHYFVLFTTDELREFNPEKSKNLDLLEEFPDYLVSLDQLTDSQFKKIYDNSIFPDLTLFDKSRTVEMERNARVKQADVRPEFPKPRLKNEKVTSFINEEIINDRFNKDIDDIPHIFDKDLILENQFLVLTGICIASLLSMWYFFKIVIFGLKNMGITFKSSKNTKKTLKKE